ncbi:MAG: carboxypeptidase-like regulatory domain-containing protein [bacterium]
MRNQSLVLVLILLAVGTVVGVALLGGDGQGPEPLKRAKPPALREGPEPSALEGIIAPDRLPAMDDVDTGLARTQAPFGGHEVSLKGRLVEQGTALAIPDGQVLASLGELSREATSSEEGTFEISLPEGLEGSFLVSHPEYVDLHAPQLPEPTAEEWVIFMQPAGSISGRLVGPGAGSGSEAQVHLWRWGGGRLEEDSMAIQVVLDDGGFEFTNLPTGAYAVAAIKEGAPPVLRSGVQVERGQRTDVLISMPLGESFTALVETRAQGGPVQGALVEVEPVLMGRGNPLEDLVSLQAFTEANGRAPFTGLSSGTHRIHIRTPWGDELTENVEISLQSGNHEQRFLFSPAARLAGRVVDPQGQGVAGSEVRCVQGAEWSRRSWNQYPSREGGVAGATITDAAGDFEFKIAPASSSFLVTAISSRSGSGGAATSGGFAISDSIRLQSGESRAGLILRLGEGFELRGIVHDTDGLPLAGVEVQGIVGWREQELAVRITTTDAQGAFVLHGVPAGRCRLTADLEGYTSGTLTKTVDQDLEGLELRVQPTHSLEGVVLDPDGWGIGGARVRARDSASRRSRSRYATADEYGRFVLEGLSPGSWSLGASAPGFPARDESKVTVDVPFASLAELRLVPEVEEAPCVLAGEIVMKGSGKPVKGLRFHGYRYQTISLDGTRFELTGPPVKKLTLSATGSNAEALTFPMVHLAPGDRVDLGRAETRHTWRVKVHVKDGSGRALSGADVRLQRVAGQESLEYVAVPKSLRLRARGLKGEYSTSQVGMYEWRLLVRHSAWNSHASTVRVSADSTSFEVSLKESRRRGGDDQ